MKMAWRKILEQYKYKYGCVINKCHFPSLLAQLMNDLMKSGQNSLIAGFRKCGIYPCDRNQVVDRIPKSDITELQNTSLVSAAVIDILEKKRFGEGSSEARSKKTKVNVTPGKSLQNVLATSLEESLDDAPVVDFTNEGVPGASGSGARTEEIPTKSRSLETYKKPKKLSINALSKAKKTGANLDDSDVSSGGYTSLSEGEEDDWGRQSSDDEVDQSPKDNTLFIGKYKPGDFLIVQYDEKYYPGKVIGVKKNETQISTISQPGPKAWKWPQRPDILWYKNVEIREKIQTPAANTSRASFVVPEMLKYKNFCYFK